MKTSSAARARAFAGASQWLVAAAAFVACGGTSSEQARQEASSSTTADVEGIPTATVGAGGASGSSTQSGLAGGRSEVPRAPYAGLCGDDKTCTPGKKMCLDPSADAGAGADGCSLAATPGGVMGSCAPNGEGADGDPCARATDCAAGLGCVLSSMNDGPGGGGVCRPYCCGDVEACGPKTFCAPRPMADDALNVPAWRVPVCAPAMPCQLLDDASCPEGEVCGVVRADGTTSCVPPGGGTLGEACPCAAGFVCAKLTGTCKKLCHLDQAATDCANGGTCQGGSLGLPAGVGVCVGGAY